MSAKRFERDGSRPEERSGGVPFLLTAPELAEHLRISTRQAYRLAEEDLVPVYRVRRGVRFNLGEVLAALRSDVGRRQEGTSELIPSREILSPETGV